MDSQAEDYSHTRFLASVNNIIAYRPVVRKVLAEQCGTNANNLRNILKSRYVSTDYRQRILNALGFSSYGELYAEAERLVAAASAAPAVENPASSANPVTTVDGPKQVDGLVFHSPSEERGSSRGA